MKIRETATSFDPAWGELMDIDPLESGHWVGLFRDAGRLFVRTPTRCVAAPGDIRFPRIRALDTERCVLVDARTEKGRANGWVVSPASGGTLEFFAGDGIQDLLASGDTIVVTYFDEGIFSGSIGNEGIALFDDSGQLRAGYRTAMGPRAVVIDDCYAACWADGSRLAFLPYQEFPLVTLDVRTLEQTMAATPERLHGSSAITMAGDITLFHSPYDEERAILAWRPGQEPEPVGTYSGRLHGSRGGRFVAPGSNGFTILEPTDDPRH